VSEPITLRELSTIDVSRIRGVAERKRAALAEFGITTVLDLLTTYPRRWVDRTRGRASPTSCPATRRSCSSR
jgi:ATP-dependent DNA helicase RecG